MPDVEGDIECLTELRTILNVCHNRLEKFVAEALEPPVVNFHKYKLLSELSSENPTHLLPASWKGCQQPTGSDGLKAGLCGCEFGL